MVTNLRAIDFRWAVPLLTVLLFVVAVGVWVVIQYRLNYALYQKEYIGIWRDNLERLAALAAEDFTSEQDHLMADMLASFSNDLGLKHIVVLDNYGHILFANDPAVVGKPASLTLPDYRMAELPLHTGNRPNTVHDPALDQWRAYYPLIRQLPGGESSARAEKFIFVNLDYSHWKDEVWAAVKIDVVMFGALGCINVLIMALFLRQFISKPIEEITGGIANFTGDEPVAIDFPGRSQLAFLAQTINKMSYDLVQSRKVAHDRQQRLDNIVESISEGVIVADRHGCVERLNAVAEQLTGWRRAEAVGRPVSEVMQLEDSTSGAALTNLADQVIKAGEPAARLNASLISRDGRVFTIGDGASPVRDMRQQIEGAVVTFRDITEAYRVREERELAAMVFEAGAPQVIADEHQIIVRANEALVVLRQGTLDDLVGKPLTAFYQQQADKTYLDILQGRHSSDTHFGRTVRKNKSNETLYFFESIKVLRKANGRPNYYIVNLQDYTSVETAVRAMQESQRNYETVIESMYDGFMVIGVDGIVECNRQISDMLGRSREDLIGAGILDISPEYQPDGVLSRVKLREIISQVIEGTVGVRLEWTALLPDGSATLLEISLTSTRVDGEAVVIANAREINARKRAEREREEMLVELTNKERMIRLANKAYGIASFELNVRSWDISWSEGAEQVLGLSTEDLGGRFRHAGVTIYEEDQDLVDSTLAKALQDGQPFKLEIRHARDDGEIRWTNTQCEVELGEDGKPLRLRGAIADITEYKIAQGEIERLAYYDPLTGLANRRLVLDRLQQACYLATRGDHGGALLFIDLDRFKLLNDSLGHKAGDMLLTSVANRLREWTRDEDTVGRMGGDEFVVILPSIGAELHEAAQNAHRVADKLQERLSGSYEVGGHAYHITASIGIALFPQDSSKAEELLHHADAAMYQAKKSGRNTVAFYQAGLQQEADSRLELEQDLRLATARNELQLYYQPKVTQSRGVLGAEALVRWNHKTRGLISPAEFIPVAEEMGLIIEIGQWVANEACRQLAEWNTVRAPERDLGISINVSPIQFRHQGFVGCIKQAISSHGVDPAKVTLEITESALIENMEDTIAKLYELKVVGVSTSIDDFGTGYSSLYYLKNLPLDEIKIDQTYVRDIIDDPNDAAIVSTIMAIGKHLGLRAVAEGVETEAQAEFLRELGCECQQGYLYSRPLPAGDFAKLYV